MPVVWEKGYHTKVICHLEEKLRRHPWNDKSHSTQLELFLGGHLQVLENPQIKQQENTSSLRPKVSPNIRNFSRSKCRMRKNGIDKTDHNKTWILPGVFQWIKWSPSENQHLMKIMQSFQLFYPHPKLKSKIWKWIRPIQRKKTMWSTIQARYAPIKMVVKVRDMCTDSWALNQPHPAFPTIFFNKWLIGPY